MAKFSSLSRTHTNTREAQTHSLLEGVVRYVFEIDGDVVTCTENSHLQSFGCHLWRKRFTLVTSEQEEHWNLDDADWAARGMDNKRDFQLWPLLENTARVFVLFELWLSNP